VSVDNYRDFQVVISPTALQKPYGKSHQRAYGIVKDYYAGLTRQAVKMAFPDFAPPDALGAIGDELSIEQGIDTLTGANESASAYAARLKNAWAKDAVRGQPPDTASSIWYWGGTAFGMLRAFFALGYRPTLIQKSGTYWSLDVSGNLVIAYNPAITGWPLWNTFLVMFNPTPASWTSPAQIATSSTVPSIDEVKRLIKIVRTWRPAQALCMGLEIIVSGRLWGYPPVGAIGAPVWGTGTWGGSVIRWGDPPTQVYPPAPF
jgi:hypothetical protein